MNDWKSDQGTESCDIPSISGWDNQKESGRGVREERLGSGEGSRRAQKWAAGGWSSKEGLSKHVRCRGCSAKVLGFSSVIATWDLNRTKQSPTGEGATETTGKELG